MYPIIFGSIIAANGSVNAKHHIRQTFQNNEAKKNAVMAQAMTKKTIRNYAKGQYGKKNRIQDGTPMNTAVRMDGRCKLVTEARNLVIKAMDIRKSQLSAINREDLTSINILKDESKEHLKIVSNNFRINHCS